MEKLLEKLGNLLYDILPHKITRNENVRLDLTSLSPAANIPEKLREFYSKKLSLCALIVVIGVIFSAYLWIGNLKDVTIVDNVLSRSEYGEGDNNYALQVTDGDTQYDISLKMQEREYTKEEIDQFTKDFVEIIDDKILGDNTSLDKVEYDLNFVEEVEGFPFTIEYKTDSDYISKDGGLVNRELLEPQLVEIDMEVSYGEYKATHTIYAMVYSKAIKPTLIELIQEQLNNEESEKREEKSLSLPDKVGETKLKWNYKRSYSGLICLIATPIIAITIFIFKDRDLHKKVDEREQEMRLDYPEIVSSLALLIGAGMTVPNAWKKIAYDYRRRREEGSGSRFAYEEMLFTIYEMESGITQSVAYERFGRRCRIPCYNKLATIVSQNIKKGAVNLPMLLKQEATEAFEDRKHFARKQGEQAGTKLLGPMMLLLVVTIIIIMVPAFRTYF